MTLSTLSKSVADRRQQIIVVPNTNNKAIKQSQFTLLNARKQSEATIMTTADMAEIDEKILGSNYNISPLRGVVTNLNQSHSNINLIQQKRFYLDDVLMNESNSSLPTITVSNQQIQKNTVMVNNSMTPMAMTNQPEPMKTPQPIVDDNESSLMQGYPYLTSSFSRSKQSQQHARSSYSAVQQP